MGFLLNRKYFGHSIYQACGKVHLKLHSYLSKVYKYIRILSSTSTTLKLKSKVYCILLIIHSEKLMFFADLLHNCNRFLVNVCAWILWKLLKAGNCESFLGIKVKTLNSKTCSLWIISNIWYSSTSYQMCSYLIGLS